jgi:hypothetical protein
MKAKRQHLTLKKNRDPGLLMGMLPAGLKVNNRVFQEALKQNASVVAAFLEFKFSEQKKPLPEEHPLYWHLSVHGVNSSQRFSQAAEVQREIREALARALDALADGKRVDDAVQKLVDMLSTLQGRPYVYQRSGNKWQRRPAVSMNTLREHWLTLIAQLFDAGKLNLLAHCHFCQAIFLAKGLGRYAKYCKHHTIAANNEKLRQRGYFAKQYQEKKRNGLQLARRLKKQGMGGQALLHELKAFGIGKTILRREGLWDLGDE